MADENVKKAQAYLNAMYGHRSEWIPLEENGYTGTVTVSATFIVLYITKYNYIIKIKS